MSEINKIEIVFPCAVEFPDGWDRALSALVGMICEKYERDNTGMVMWTSGHGCIPVWNETHDPWFDDDSIYQIEVAAREDYYGDNPHNPRREELREKVRANKRKNKVNDKGLEDE